MPPPRADYFRQVRMGLGEGATYWDQKRIFVYLSAFIVATPCSMCNSISADTYVFVTLRLALKRWRGVGEKKSAKNYAAFWRELPNVDEILRIHVATCAPQNVRDFLFHFCTTTFFFVDATFWAPTSRNPSSSYVTLSVSYVPPSLVEICECSCVPIVVPT